MLRSSARSLCFYDLHVGNKTLLSTVVSIVQLQIIVLKDSQTERLPSACAIRAMQKGKEN